MANPFFVNPSTQSASNMQSSMSGLARVLEGERERSSAAAADQAEQERITGVRRGAAEVMQGGDPQAIAEYSLNNPEVEPWLNQQVGIQSDQQKQDASNFARDLLTSSPERQGELYQRRIGELEAQGRDPSDTIQSYQDWAKDPQGEIRQMTYFYAASDPKGYEALAAESEEGFKAQEIDIKRETLDLRRMENEARRQDADIAREGNALKREKMQLDVDEKRQKIEQKKADVEKGASDALAAIDTSIESVDRLLEHPGLEAAVGVGAAFPTIPGSSAADFEAELASFEAQNFLTAVKQMKGMGALSENEGKKLSAAVGAISPNMSEKAFKKSMGTIKEGFEKAKGRMVERGMAPAATEQPATQYSEGQTATNPNTGQKMVFRNGQWGEL